MAAQGMVHTTCKDTVETMNPIANVIQTKLMNLCQINT